MFALTLQERPFQAHCKRKMQELEPSNRALKKTTLSMIEKMKGLSFIFHPILGGYEDSLAAYHATKSKLSSFRKTPLRMHSKEKNEMKMYDQFVKHLLVSSFLDDRDCLSLALTCKALIQNYHKNHPKGILQHDRRYTHQAFVRALHEGDYHILERMLTHAPDALLKHLLELNVDFQGIPVDPFTFALGALELNIHPHSMPLICALLFSAVSMLNSADIVITRVWKNLSLIKKSHGFLWLAKQIYQETDADVRLKFLKPLKTLSLKQDLFNAITSPIPSVQKQIQLFQAFANMSLYIAKLDSDLRKKVDYPIQFLKFFLMRVLNSTTTPPSELDGGQVHYCLIFFLKDLCDFSAELLANQEMNRAAYCIRIWGELKFEYKMAKIEKEDVDASIEEIMKKVDSLPISSSVLGFCLQDECVLLSGGYARKVSKGGHYVKYVITKTAENSFNFITVNTGEAAPDSEDEKDLCDIVYIGLDRRKLSRIFFKKLLRRYPLETIKAKNQEEINASIAKSLFNGTNRIQGPRHSQQKHGSCTGKVNSSFLHRRMTDLAGNSVLYWRFKVFYTKKWIAEFDCMRQDIPKEVLERLKLYDEQDLKDIFKNYSKSALKVLKKREKKQRIKSLLQL